jgi:hypothetical protein
MMSLNFLGDLIIPATLLGSIHFLTEMSTRNLPGVKGRRHNADSLTAICEPII